MCILCWNPLSYILLCHNIESPLLRRQNGFGTVGVKRGGGVFGGCLGGGRSSASPLRKFGSGYPPVLMQKIT